ncbi:MAG: AAA family ATPase [Actinobacteria bacterium]|nr:AAA family ATPase [Actinomycetota bacterium]
MIPRTGTLRCPILVGRDAEVDALAGLVGEARAGRGAAVLVRGAAGVGKTRLVTETLAAGSGEAVALWGRCSRLHHGASLAPLTDAFLPATRAVAAPSGELLLPFVAALGAVVPHWSASEPTVRPAPAVVGEGICRLLDHLAGDGMVSLVVEDLHWSDPDTIAVLDYVARHLRGLPVCVVLTTRPDEPGEPAGLAELVGSTPILDLAPLSDAHVRAMAAACLEVDDAPDQIVRHLDAAAGGLPLLIEDLIATNPGVAPQRFAEVVLSRVDALPASSRPVIEVAAIAGDRVSVDLLVAASGVPAAKVSEALHHAAARQLLVADPDGLRFRHALTADIISYALEPAARRDYCSRVAAALEAQEPADHAGAGELWLAAGRTRNAAVCLLRAADCASVGGVLSAVDLYRRVLDIEPDRRTRQAATAGLLEALVDAGHLDRAATVGGAALDHVAPSSDDATRIRLTLAWVHIQRREREPATVHLDAARRNHPTDPVILARLRLTEAQLALAFDDAGRLDVTRHLAAQAIGLAEAARDHSLTCEALEVASLCERDRSLTTALAPLERIFTIAANERLGLWRLRALNEIGTIEALRDASGDRLERARAEATALGAPGTLASIELNLAALHVMCGRTGSARSAAQVCRDIAEPLGLVPMVAAATMIEGLAAGYDGNAGTMAQLLRDAEGLAGDDPDLLALAWAAGRGMSALLTEDRDRARAAFERADRYPSPARTLNPARGPLLMLRAVTGEPVDGAITEALANSSPDARYPTMWLTFARAVALGAAGNRGDAMAAFAEADRLARPYVLFRAIALRVVAEAAQRDGWGEPTVWLRDAEAEFVTRAHAQTASACRALLKHAGERATRRRGADANVSGDLLTLGVTAREAEVLDLIAQRLTNNEIADRLYLSPRTVEKHVANLLTKTACANRRELAAWAEHHRSTTDIQDG